MHVTAIRLAQLVPSVAELPGDLVDRVISHEA